VADQIVSHIARQKSACFDAAATRSDQRGNNGQGSGYPHLSEKNRDDARETIEHKRRLSAHMPEIPFVHLLVRHAVEYRPDKTPPTTCASTRTRRGIRGNCLASHAPRPAAACAGMVQSKD